MEGTKPLAIVDGKSLLALDVEPPRFRQAYFRGGFILSGSAHRQVIAGTVAVPEGVRTGEKAWEFETRKCITLYLALEDRIVKFSVLYNLQSFL